MWCVSCCAGDWSGWCARRWGECPSVGRPRHRGLGGAWEEGSRHPMPMLLFRSLLRDVLTNLSGHAFSAREPTRGPTMRYLIVVARNQPALYEHLRNRHGRDPGVQVVVDRRGDGNVETTADPPPVERRRRRSWLATGASHELVELPAEDTAGPGVRNRNPVFVTRRHHGR